MLVVGQPGETVEVVVRRHALSLVRTGRVGLHDALPVEQPLGSLSAVHLAEALNDVIAQATELRQHDAAAKQQCDDESKSAEAVQ